MSKSTPVISTVQTNYGTFPQVETVSKSRAQQVFEHQKPMMDQARKVVRDVQVLAQPYAKVALEMTLNAIAIHNGVAHLQKQTY